MKTRLGKINEHDAGHLPMGKRGATALEVTVPQKAARLDERPSRAREIKQAELPNEQASPTLPLDSQSKILTLIERVALDPVADAEKLERLTAMYERLKAKEAELAYNAAKGRILKKLAGIKIVKNRSLLPEIGKGKLQGVSEAFKYAPLEEIDKHLRPLLAEEKMDLSYSGERQEGGGILIRGRLKHLPSGHYEDSFMPAPPDTTGGSLMCRQWGAPIPSCADTLPATSSISWSSATMTTESEEPLTRSRRRQFSISLKKQKSGPSF